MKIKLLSIIFTLIFCAFSSVTSISNVITVNQPAQATKSDEPCSVVDHRCESGCANRNTGQCCIACPQ